MESVTVYCPNCKTAYQEGQCNGCRGSLADFAPMFQMVCAAYNSSLELARNGKAERAWSELANVMPAFPFVDRALELLFELSLMVREFDMAARSAAWIAPLGNNPSSEELQKRIAEASSNSPSIYINDQDQATENQRPLQVTSGSGTVSKNRVIFGLVVAGSLAISISAVIFGVNSTKKAADIDKELLTSSRRYEDLAARSSAMVDSLEYHSLEQSTKSEKDIVAAQQDAIAWRNRAVQLGPHVIYRSLYLQVHDSDDRVENMALFVELFPDNDAYTGPFLRELYDNLKNENPNRALGYAKQLNGYCLKRPNLAKTLISREIRRVLAQENNDA